MSNPPSAPIGNSQDFIDYTYLDFLGWLCDSFVRCMKLCMKTFRDDPSNIEEGIMHAQNAIVFAGDVSKMLWPKVKHKTRLARAEKRANRLRQLLNIQSDSLLQNLDIRNKMEHLDEYVDEWAAKDGPLICFNTWNMPPSEYVFYNLADSKFSMLGDEINLMDLSISVGKVQQAVKREIEPIKKRVWPFAPDSGA